MEKFYLEITRNCSGTFKRNLEIQYLSYSKIMTKYDRLSRHYLMPEFGKKLDLLSFILLNNAFMEDYFTS